MSLKVAYKVPAWCTMPKRMHLDGKGECFSISDGLVERKGESHCIGCMYHKDFRGWLRSQGISSCAELNRIKKKQESWDSFFYKLFKVGF